MNKNQIRRILIRKDWLFLSIVSLLLSCASTPNQKMTSIDDANNIEAADTLRLALYPYVPRISQFSSAIQSAWKQLEPGITLEIVSSNQWDGGYNDNPADSVDVYVFDAINLNYFRSQGWLDTLATSEINGLSDFLSYAIEGIKINGSYYGIPLLGCANILFYRDGDQAIDTATTLKQLNVALGECKYKSQVPPDSQGLMVDLSGGTTNACYYVDAEQSLTNQYPISLPWNTTEVDTNAIHNLQELLTMSSYWNGTKSTANPYQRGTWFAEGRSQAMVGFTESMSAMGDSGRAIAKFKVLPLSDTSSRPLFYSDVIGINTKTSDRKNAIKLANLLASTGNVINSIGPTDTLSAQYLMPTRPSIFDSLGASDSIYKAMYQMVTQGDPILFVLDSTSRDWISAMKDTIKTMIRQDFPCGCDMPAGPIWNQQDAEAKCPSTCANLGGWSGSWVTTVSGQESMCGCNQCPVSK